MQWGYNLRWQVFLPLVLLFVACSYESSMPKAEYPILKNEFINYRKNNYLDDKYILQERILKASEKYKYTPYKLGGVSYIKGTDCSAFTQSVFKEAFNINLARTTIFQKKGGKFVKQSNLKTGDLVFFKSTGPNGLHVGIYLNNHRFIHLSTHGGARVQKLYTPYWAKRYLFARRYL